LSFVRRKKAKPGPVQVITLTACRGLGAGTCCELELRRAGACGDVGVRLALTRREVGPRAQLFLERATCPIPAVMTVARPRTRPGRVSNPGRVYSVRR